MGVQVDMTNSDEKDKKPDKNGSNNYTQERHEESGPDESGKVYEFSDLNTSADPQGSGDIEFILDIPLEITVELGRTKLMINELLKLGQGSIVELSKNGGESLDVLANQRLIARGEVVIVNDKYGVRLTEIVSPMERIENLR